MDPAEPSTRVLLLVAGLWRWPHCAQSALSKLRTSNPAVHSWSVVIVTDNTTICSMKQVLRDFGGTCPPTSPDAITHSVRSNFPEARILYYTSSQNEPLMIDARVTRMDSPFFARLRLAMRSELRDWFMRHDVMFVLRPETVLTAPVLLNHPALRNA